MAVNCVLSHEHLRAIGGATPPNSVPATLLGASSSIDPRRVSPPPPPTQRNQHEQHGPPPPHLQRYQPGAYGYTLPGPTLPHCATSAVYASHKRGPLAASTLRAGQGSAFFVRIFLCIRAGVFFPPRPFRVRCARSPRSYCGLLSFLEGREPLFFFFAHLPFQALAFWDGSTLQLAAAWLAACALCDWERVGAGSHYSSHHVSCIRARLRTCLDGVGLVGCIGFDPHPRAFPFLTVLATSVSPAAAAARISIGALTPATVRRAIEHAADTDINFGASRILSASLQSDFTCQLSNPNRPQCGL
ncbi:hypothetical protein B0H16DRAFT_1887707 [Mycena metata]|uniref:Uncharacterized protein n=1 Tax=Mycena metata TaxID=1033252 RepID=A0AAD7N926_9AGAR|nr:hypothetical protein B0H16DRAFT_1887707 [Mycena metata]